MGSRNWAEVAPNPNTIALNAYIHGYGGHSLVTPHAALKRLWWTGKRIDAKVDRAYVLSKLRGEEREFLDRIVGFGSDRVDEPGIPRTNDGAAVNDDGDDEVPSLTSSTYMDWILTRAKRLFLILAEIGVPDQIFGCIDDSWDDGDLPIALEDVKRLELSVDENPAFDQKFHDTQFVYMLRELKAGDHIDYDSRELIPLEHVDKVPPAVAVQEYGGRIHFPGKPDEVFMRRKVSFLDKDASGIDSDMVLEDVRKAQSLPHPHIVPAWATYTCGEAGFVLADFVAEHTLSTYIDHRMPTSLLRVTPSKRSQLLIEWMSCLTEALAYLHEHGEAHTRICPSNIWIDKDNRIAFSDLGRLRSFQTAKKTSRAELYEYAAPESAICRAQSGAASTSTSPRRAPSSLGRRRKRSIETIPTPQHSPSTTTVHSPQSERFRFSPSSRISSSESGQSPGFEHAVINILTSPGLSRPRVIRITEPLCSSPSQLSPLTSSSHDFSRHDSNVCSFSERPGTIPSGLRIQHPTILTSISTPPDMLQDIVPPSPEMSDIFSLGCIFLDILTFLLKGKNTDFVKFRAYGEVSPLGKRHRRRDDSSFHSDPDIVWHWTCHLEEVCLEKGEIDQKTQVRKSSIDEQNAGCSGANKFPVREVMELLELTRVMLYQNALLRPTAKEIRQRTQDILACFGGLQERLCQSCLPRNMEHQEASILHGDGFVAADNGITDVATGRTVSENMNIDDEAGPRISGLDEVITDLLHQERLFGIASDDQTDSASRTRSPLHSPPHPIQDPHPGCQVLDHSTIMAPSFDPDRSIANLPSLSRSRKLERMGIAADVRASAAAMKAGGKKRRGFKSYFTRAVWVR